MPNPFRKPGDAAEHWERRLDIIEREEEEGGEADDDGGEDETPPTDPDKQLTSDALNKAFEFDGSGTDQTMAGISEDDKVR